MKFSELDKRQWEELQQYLDTCLLPVTALTGAEAPWEAVQELERLRDALDLLEIPFKGRTVTYPAFHFTGDSESGENDTRGQVLDEVCRRMKASGFRHVVIVSARLSREALVKLAPSADLALSYTPETLASSPAEAKEDARYEITALWTRKET